MEEIERLSGQSCGVHRTGAVLLAGTEDRLDWLRMLAARGRFHGAEQRIISIGEAQELLPIMDPSHFVGALHDPLTSHVDPSGVTHAYAKAAQALGASVTLRNPVVDTVRRPDGGWEVVTEKEPFTPSMSSMRAGSGRAKSGEWPDWSFPFWPWSTITS